MPDSLWSPVSLCLLRNSVRTFGVLRISAFRVFRVIRGFVFVQVLKVQSTKYHETHESTAYSPQWWCL